MNHDRPVWDTNNYNEIREVFREINDRKKKKTISRTVTILIKRTTSGNHHRTEDDKWQIIIISPHRIALNAHATATARRTGCSVYAGWKVGTQKIIILSPLRSDHYATSLMISYLSTLVDSDKNVFKTII